MKKHLLLCGLILFFSLLFFAPKVLAGILAVLLTIFTIITFLVLGLFPLVLDLIAKFSPTAPSET